MKKYQIIYADPPWYEHGAGHYPRSADRHYPIMKTKDIIDLPVNKITCNNAHLYLWVVNNRLQDGFKVMEAWGFKYITIITWVKAEDQRNLGFGYVLQHFGLGQYFRGLTEHCLFGVKGFLPYKVNIDNKRQQGKTVILAPRGKYSQKPDVMREMIIKVSDRSGYNKIELFAREKTKGWDVWGNEVESDVKL